jgi:hypothetical protein
VKENFHKIGMSEDKFILLLENCTAYTREFELQSGNVSVLYLPLHVTSLSVAKEFVQNMKCYYQRDFLHKLVNDEGTLKDFQQIYMIKDAVFNIASAWNSVKAKTVSQGWRKLWPAIMTAQVALEEEDFTGFNGCNKDTVH